MATNDIKQKLYNFIVEYKSSNDGCAPTYREIQAHLRLKTTSRLHDMLKELQAERKVVIAKKHGRRMIKVVGGTWAPPR